jgi:hypothetical protein
VPELARDKLVRSACTNRADRVEVPSVVHAMVRQSEDAEPLAMSIAGLLTINAAEEALARRERVEMFLQRRPSPFRNSDDAIPRVGLSASRSHFAPGDVHVRLYAGEGRRDLNAGAIEEREERVIRWLCSVHDTTNVFEVDLDDARPHLWRRLDVALWVPGKDSHFDSACSSREFLLWAKTQFPCSLTRHQRTWQERNVVAQLQCSQASCVRDQRCKNHTLMVRPVGGLLAAHTLVSHF